MPSFLHWLDTHTALLSLFITLLATLFTGVYVWFTGRLVKETISLRKVETEPTIVVYIEWT